jgi:hypothetical protein
MDSCEMLQGVAEQGAGTPQWTVGLRTDTGELRLRMRRIRASAGYLFHSLFIFKNSVRNSDKNSVEIHHDERQASW